MVFIKFKLYNMYKFLLKFSFSLLIIFTLNSCSLTYFVSKTQKVEILKEPNAKVLIDKKEAVMDNDKYVLPINLKATNLTLTKDGCKPINKIIIPYKLTPEGYASIAFNIGVGIYLVTNFIPVSPDFPLAVAYIQRGFGGLLGGIIGGGGSLMLAPNLFKFPNAVYLDKYPLLFIPMRDSLMKEIYLNNVSIQLKPEDIENTTQSYTKYLKNEKPIKKESEIIEGTIIENSSLSDELNSLLKKSGFIDTSRILLKSSYKNNAYLNASIIGYRNNQIESFLPSKTDNIHISFFNIDMKIKWDVLDFYKNIVYSDTIVSKSSDIECKYNFTGRTNNVLHYSLDSKLQQDAFHDALETNLYTLMNNSKFKGFMHLDKKVTVEPISQLTITKSNSYVSSIEQAVDASVTIKSKNGHGSGFFISEDGYITTSYHVIADSTKLEVVLNDGSIYIPKVIRVNKSMDLALLKIDKKSIIPFNLSTDVISEVGKEIYVIGTPSAQDLSQTLTKGIISSIRKSEGEINLIQTDASISPGNSGGSLIDKDGNLLGIVDFKLVGVGVEGIAFALPAPVITVGLSIQIK